jgi:carboxyl-terminal processing protease
MENVPIKRSTRVISYVIIFGVVFYLGWAFGGAFNAQPANGTSNNIFNNFGKAQSIPEGVDLTTFWKVRDILKDKYVHTEKLDDQKMIYGAIRGLTDALEDPYTIYMDPTETAEFSHSLNGEMEGIGAELTVKNQQLMVVSPLKNSPAQKAGLKPNDIIYKINGEIAAELSLYDAINNIRGEKGTEVTLTIVREGVNEPFDVKIIREELRIESVTSEEVEPGIWMISIDQFSDDTKAELYKQAAEIQAKNPKGIILDLRYNGGGYLEGSVDVASVFVKGKEKIVTIKYRNAEESETLSSSGEVILADVPLLVLINKGSASASEIVAGALQDLKRAVIMGETSFGKGTVQEVDPLADGSSIRFTIAKWFTPLDREIDKVGIVPDIEVKLTEEDFLADKDPQMDEAVKYLKNL